MIPLNQNLSPLKRSAIRVYTNLAKEVPGCVMLTIGEPDFDTPQAIKAAACAALAAGQTHYAPNQGTAALRKAVADYETRRGRAVTPEQVLITVGATHALFTALLGILNPGEEVIVPTPGFGLYETIATVAGAKTVRLDVTKNNFQITKEALEAAITPKTALVLLNSPNNPSGAVYPREDLEVLTAMLKRRERELGHPIYLLADEPYRELVYGGAEVPFLPSLYPDTLYCYSFSKSLSIPGERVGFLAFHPEMAERDRLFDAVQGAMRMTGYLCVSPLFQLAAAECLGVTADISVYERNRDLICSGLRELGYRFPEPRGGFYLLLQAPEGDGRAFSRRCMAEDVLLVPGEEFFCPGYVRLAYCVPEERLRRSLPAFRRIAESCGILP